MDRKNYSLVGSLLCCVVAGTIGVAHGAIVSVTASGASGNGEFLIVTPFMAGGAKAFNGLDSIDLTLTVDSAGIYTIDESSPSIFPGILNASGSTWTDFEFQILGVPPGASFRTAGESTLYPAKFPDVSQTTDLVRFSGGQVPSVQGMPGRTYGFDPLFSLQVSGPGTVVIRETPSVPEPSSLALMTGALGWVVGHWRLRRRSSGAVAAPREHHRGGLC